MLFRDLLGVMWKIREDNDKFVIQNSGEPASFNASEENSESCPVFCLKQSPRATMVLCCDSRIHPTAFVHFSGKKPFSDYFITRVIGNVFETALGSICFGVEQFATPLLLFLGHTGCGAIEAACQKKRCSSLSVPICHEIDHISTDITDESPSETFIQKNIFKNTYAQVDKACAYFKKLITNHQLTVVGAVIDLMGQMEDKQNKIHFIAVNHTRRKAKLSAKGFLVIDEDETNPVDQFLSLPENVSEQGVQAILAKTLSSIS